VNHRLLSLCLLTAACATPRFNTFEEKEAPAPTVAAPSRPAGPVTYVSPPPPGRLAEVPLQSIRSAERVLPNGLKVVVVEHARRPLVRVRLVLPHGGSVDEELLESGQTALAMRLLGDGYELDQNGKELFHEKSLARQVGEAGGALSFNTTHDLSWMGIDGYAVDLPRYLELVADGVRKPRAGAEAFGARRDGMLDALEDREGDDPTLFYDLLRQAAFGPEHSYGRPSYGVVDGLNVFGVEDVVVRQRKLLTPGGAVLLIVGAVKAEEAFALARETVGKWVTPRAPLPAAVVTPVSLAPSSAVLIPRKPARTTQLCLARPLSDVKASDAAVELLAAILGDQRLYQELRELRGLTYSTSAELWRVRHARALLACTAVRGKATEEGLKIIQTVLGKLRSAPPTVDEVNRARAQLRTRLRATHEDLNSISAAWLHALELGRTVSAQRDLAELDAVTPAQLHQLARQVLAPDHLQWVFVGEPEQVEAAARKNGLRSLQRRREPRSGSHTTASASDR
jgi:zinc protease